MPFSKHDKGDKNPYDENSKELFKKWMEKRNGKISQMYGLKEKVWYIIWTKVI